MSMSGDDAYVLAMDYVDETLKGGGALKGDDGKSAYQSWLDLGNTGTEEDFINSLKGEKGQVGEKGETGNNGKSSYEIWLDNGNVGTEQDFLDSLKGDGADGFSPVITENSNNTDEDYRLDIETKESKITTPNLKADIRKNIAEHNTSPDSHNDIRIFLNELNNRLNALANSDDETLDEMKEVVAYIKDNRSLIESITTTKVNVADIIDNLTTNVSNKPLSASQGVVIKNLIDTLQSELTAHANNADIHVTASDKTNWNNKTQRVNLSGQLQRDDYRRSVIALCNVYEYPNCSFSVSNGKLTIRRFNGLSDSCATIDLCIGADYESNFGINASILENSYDYSGSNVAEVKPCTFKYNGTMYGGVELTVSPSYSSLIFFDGYTNFPIFGLDYYNYSSGEVLNADVYNSINFENVSYSNRFYHNLKKVYTEENLNLATASVKSLQLQPTLTTDKEIDEFNESGKLKLATIQGVNIPKISGKDGIIISVPWTHTAYGAQLIIDDQTNTMLMRTKDNVIWNPWVEMLHTGNSLMVKTIDVPTNYIYDVIGDKEGNIQYSDSVGVVNLRIDFFTTYEIEASKILAIYVEADKKLKGFVWDPLIESQVISGNTLYSFEIKDINSNSGSVAVTSCKLLYMV